MKIQQRLSCKSGKPDRPRAVFSPRYDSVDFTADAEPVPGATSTLLLRPP